MSRENIFQRSRHTSTLGVDVIIEPNWGPWGLPARCFKKLRWRTASDDISGKKTCVGMWIMQALTLQIQCQFSSAWLDCILLNTMSAYNLIIPTFKCFYRPVAKIPRDSATLLVHQVIQAHLWEPAIQKGAIGASAFFATFAPVIHFFYRWRDRPATMAF